MITLLIEGMINVSDRNAIAQMFFRNIYRIPSIQICSFNYRYSTSCFVSTVPAKWCLWFETEDNLKHICDCIITNHEFWMYNIENQNDISIDLTKILKKQNCINKGEEQ